MLISIVLAATVAFREPKSFGGEIHVAVSNRQIKVVEDLLSSNPDSVGSRDEFQQTALHIAAREGDVAIGRLLLNLGADVNAVAVNNLRPLHMASTPEFVKLLLHHGADVEAKCADADRTALGRAARLTTVDEDDVRAPARAIVKLLLDAGAYYDIRSAIHLDDEARFEELLRGHFDSTGKRPELLRIAASDGRTTMVKRLIQVGGDPNDRSFFGLPVAYFAVDRPSVLAVLMNAGADPQIAYEYRGSGLGPPAGSTLLHAAAQKGQITSARILIERGAVLDARDRAGRTPLHVSAAEGHSRMARFLLQKGAKPDSGDNCGETAISLASALVEAPDDDENEDDNCRYRAVIKELMAAGASSDIFSAIALGDQKQVGAILEATPGSANKRDCSGTPAIIRAVVLNQLETMNLLLGAGAAPDMTDSSGSSALHVAAFWGRSTIAQTLVDRKANVNIRNKRRVTPLHESVRMETLEVIAILLDAGADVNCRDDDQHTPLGHLRTRAASSRVRDLLLRRGAIE